MNGPKNEGEKLRYDLVPPIALRGVAAVLTLGDAKHPSTDGLPNWIGGLSFMSHYGAMMRHAEAWRAGEECDAEGFHHLAAVAANAMILHDMAVRHMGSDFDDRPPPVPQSCPVD